MFTPDRITCRMSGISAPMKICIRTVDARTEWIAEMDLIAVSGVQHFLHSRRSREYGTSLCSALRSVEKGLRPSLGICPLGMEMRGSDSGVWT